HQHPLLELKLFEVDGDNDDDDDNHKDDDNDEDDDKRKKAALNVVKTIGALQPPKRPEPGLQPSRHSECNGAEHFVSERVTRTRFLLMRKKYN
ncbi:hypothetical protein MZO24_016835, partial [Enterococcus faecalis]|nr:hypothetical protein [Enterococcus faecalis]